MEVQKATLVATLGGKPHLVSFLLDGLLAQGEKIDQVVVIYLAPYLRSQAAVQSLAHEFQRNRYAGQTRQFRAVPIKVGHADLPDIRTPAEVEVVHRTERHEENQPLLSIVVPVA